VLANARMLKNVPGRKDRRQRCDVAGRTAGARLIGRSFVPDQTPRRCANLMRTRKQWFVSSRDTCSGCKRPLEDANIKLDSCCPVDDQERRAMIAALIAGETNPVKLARLATRGSRRHRRTCARRFVAA